MNLGIVTISFNQARYLVEAMDSVSLSDPSRLRYVIVDPGSTDDSRALIESRRERFQRIVFEADHGPADGLNKGFAACDADIYGYLNSDDRFSPGALDWVLRYFERHPEVDVLLGAVRLIDAVGKAHWRRSLAWSFTPEAVLAGTANAVQQATFFRARAWAATKGFNVQNKTCWDFELLVDMLLAGARFAVVHRVLGEFRIHRDGLTGAGSFSQGGRLHAAVARDAERILARVAAAGFRRPAPAAARWRQLAHRFNPLRRALEVWIR
jgi:glycosyltransferase involved in cell wall biosynthesis